MNRIPLERDAKALHSLAILGASLDSNDAVKNRAAMTGYALLKGVNSDREWLSRPVSTGAFYHTIKKLIKNNLIEALDPGVASPSPSGGAAAQAMYKIKPSGAEFYREHLEEFVASELAHPRADLLIGLLLISWSGGEKLAPWVRRVKAELIKANQDVRQNLGGKAIWDDGSLALESWRLAEGEAMFGLMQRIERQLIGVS